MCVSCLANVLENDGPKRVVVEHVNDSLRERPYSLSTASPGTGDWVSSTVVTSSIASNAADAQRAVGEIRRGERDLPTR